MTWGDVWVILHTLAAIVAFGSMFAFGIIGAHGARDPRHALFATKLVETIATRLTLPGGLVVLITGGILIDSMDIDFSGSEWLWISVVVYLLAFAFVFLVQRPALRRIIGIMEGLEASPPPAGGPPPELARLIKRNKIGGMLLMIAIVAILVLMVWKPGASWGG